ncbi:hypothetical protein NM688_g3022 [Phlebia brevispora]|uniref:Uncharacterized protein n=1 Tax=Phlebia brevispora TaxID=194682 RepID=A0ACC1T6V3_9APHY|nr:hypothetical protein NM688_g3022 [Phlebia brevispora]
MHKVLWKDARPVDADAPTSDITGSIDAIPSSLAPPSSPDDSGPSLNVFLPQLVVEYKKPDQFEKMALNQVRIKTYPVFALATHGPLGNLIMVWMSENGAIYIMEQNIRKFDISNPLSAFHFASVLIRLRARDKILKEMFKEHEEELIMKLAKRDGLQWAMERRSGDQPKKKVSRKSRVAAQSLATLREDDEQVRDLTNRMLSTRIK